MKKINIVKKNEDFKRAITKGKQKKYELFNIYIERTNNQVHHFGISVSKKIGNAVVRNKTKRRLKSIIDKKNYQNNFNCIIIVKRAINNYSYKEIEEQLLNALRDLNIIEGEINEKQK